MPKNWKTYALGDLIEHQKGFAFKSNWYQKNGAIIVRVSDTTGNSIDISTCNKIDENLASAYERFKIQFNDIVIATVGSWPPNYASVVGKVIKVPQEADGSLLNQNAVRLRTKNPEKFDQKFIYYLMKSDTFLKYIVHSAQGSANQASIKLTDIFNFSFSLPKISEQKSIASILSALDDKIELNLQMNKTLEEMAMALYKQWFVDFGPFQEGEFVDFELGEIPKGWEVKKLPEISKNHNKKRKPLSTRVRANRQGIYPYYGATKILDYIDEYKFDGEYILLAEDGTVKTERDTPFLQFVEGKFWVSNHAHVLTGTREYSNEFLYLCLNNKNVIPIITGAVQLKINKQNLESLEFVVPPKGYLKLFEEIIIPLFQQQKFIVKENITLTQLRDTLLPKLISGEVRVKDAEKTLSEVL